VHRTRPYKATLSSARILHSVVFAISLMCPISLITNQAQASEQYSATESQEESEAKLKQLKANISKLASWLKTANQEKSGLASKLKSQEKRIAKASKEIRETRAKITTLLKEIDQLKRSIKEQKNALKAQQNYLTVELRALYLDGKQPKLKALLDQNNPQDSARYLSYFNYLRDARADKLSEYKNAVAELEDTQTKALRRQNALSQEKQTLEENRTLLKEQNAKRKLTLQLLTKNINDKSQQLTQLKENQQRLEALLLQVEKSISELELPSESSPFSGRKSKLPWPSRGKVIERFGSRLAQGKLHSNGIRIAAKEDTEVVAVHYGRVVFSDWLRGFGLLIIIDHGEGFLSLYGNNKSLLREVGDWVRPGEGISHAGNSGGLNRPSLYFEIRKNGKPQNPLRWLRK